MKAYTAQTRPHIDPWVIAAQLGIPPDASYLLDGLNRTIRIIEQEAPHLEFALRIVVGMRLGPDDLLRQIERFQNWVSSKLWSEAPQVLLPMSRSDADERHPLAGYCLTALFHWPNLFYEVPPTTTGMVIEPTRYRRLIQQFSVHVIAAHSTADSAAYRDYCARWFADDVVPDDQLLQPPQLSSRTAAACRVIRRITTPGFEKLFDLLTVSTAPYHEALQNWDITKADDIEGNAVRSLSRFLHTVIPGWKKPNGLETRGSAADTGKRTHVVIRQHFEDGFVRVSASDAIVHLYTSDAGVNFESFVPRPLTESELTRQIAEQARRAPSDADFEDFGDEDEARAENQQFAAVEAAKLLDGHQWLPVAERLDAEGIETVLLPVDLDNRTGTTDGMASGATIRWALDHRRRFQFAHQLTVDRLSAFECQKLFDVIAATSVDADGAVLMALHASVALGRQFEQTCRLRIHDRKGVEWQPDETLRYVIQTQSWYIRIPPPAYADKPIARCERDLSDELCLPDATGFFGLASRHRAAGARLPILRLTAPRKLNAQQWVKSAVSGRIIRLSQLPAAMFHSVLHASRGDLGVARLLTGRDHAHSGSVAHYSNCKQSDLQRIYRSACHGLSIASNNDPISSIGTVHDVAHGAKRVATLAAAQKLIATMLEQLEQTNGIERHNHYTAYTWVGCVLGLGMRPLASVHLHELARGIGALPIISFIDKARSDYHRRLAVIPAPLTLQLNRYARYLVDQHQDLPMTLGSFFFIDPTTQAAEAFRPSHFETMYSAVFDLEPYALRRFMRTELASKRNTSAEIIDAFMGHWNDGVSPHDAFSTFPFRALYPFVREHVTKLLKDVGYSARWYDHGRR
ncbi:MAG: hypothetical protein QE272_12135 [Nevskia sp.]|nr:hypothetical protein [Nevskia sp.]